MRSKRLSPVCLSLSPPQKLFLRQQAERKTSSVAQVLRELVQDALLKEVRSAARARDRRVAGATSGDADHAAAAG